jgi:hypothetical protein
MFAHAAIPLSLSSPEIRKELHNVRFAGYYAAGLFDESVLIRLPIERKEYVRACLQIITDLTAQALILHEAIIHLAEVVKFYDQHHPDETVS